MSARNVCEWSRLRFASFFALLLIVVGWSMSGAAQAGELSRPAVAALPDGPEPAQWGDVLHDTPQGEVSAIEAEADGDPVAPELPRITKPVFGCTAKLTPSGQVLRVVTETYTVRFAASPVLARAPPHGAR